MLVNCIQMGKAADNQDPAFLFGIHDFEHLNSNRLHHVVLPSHIPGSGMYVLPHGVALEAQAVDIDVLDLGSRILADVDILIQDFALVRQLPCE